MIVDRNAVKPGDTIEFMEQKRTRGTLEGEVEYTITTDVYVKQGRRRYLVEWHRVTDHWPKGTRR